MGFFLLRFYPPGLYRQHGGRHPVWPPGSREDLRVRAAFGRGKAGCCSARGCCVEASEHATCMMRATGCGRSIVKLCCMPSNQEARMDVGCHRSVTCAQYSVLNNVDLQELACSNVNLKPYTRKLELQCTHAVGSPLDQFTVRKEKPWLFSLLPLILQPNSPCLDSTHPNSSLQGKQAHSWECTKLSRADACMHS